MNRQITLLIDEPLQPGDTFTAEQAALYNFLLERSLAGDPPSIVEMVDAMDCSSPLPIESRLTHLQEKGALEITYPMENAA